MVYVSFVLSAVLGNLSGVYFCGVLGLCWVCLWMVCLGCTIPEMRIWSILLIQSDLKL